MSRASFHGVILAIVLLFCAGPLFGQQVSSSDVAGGSGGRVFSDSLPTAGARVVEVRIRSGDAVDSVQILYSFPDGRVVSGGRHGGSGGRENVFRLDSDEYIIGLSGRYGDSIDSLRIHTNKRVTQPFGGRGGDREYRIEIPGGNQAIGFVGRAGDLLDAIGLAYAPISTPRRRGFGSDLSGPQTQVDQTTISGGRGGSGFSDPEVPSGARIIEVRIRGGELVDAIQAYYEMPDGRVVEGPRHGRSGGRESIFRLDSDEYVIGISGRCGDHIDSIRIQTNKRVSQDFGGRGGDREFRVEVPPRNQAIGFAGRAGEYLDAIGLTYAPVNESNFRSRRSRRP